MNRFELFVALRYLRAKRKQAVISVITVISILGVAAGVMSLVIALAITTGMRTTLQKNLLSVAPHVNLLDKENRGIDNWRELRDKFLKIPHVTAAAPVLFAPVFITGVKQSDGIFLQGIDASSERTVSEALRNLKEGSLDRLNSDEKIKGIIVGRRLAQEIGLALDRTVRVMSPQGNMTPFGPTPRFIDFRVVGIFESGSYDFDKGFAYASLPAVQNALSLEDVVNTVEVRIDNPDLAPEVAAAVKTAAGPRFDAITWMEQNRQLFGALEMEKRVTIVVIGLITLIAALNILIALVMTVMERYRDIAILMSMGARKQQIRRIFMTQGVLIGVVGSAIGLAVGYSLCYFADRYQWITLDRSVYMLNYVPFKPRAIDGIWIAAAAILVSFLATIYPARNATKIAPTEVLRYE